MRFTLAEKLSTVETLIEEFRWARDMKHSEQETRIYEVLKAIASDLRGRMDGAPSVAEVALERQINAAIAAKTPSVGYPHGTMIALGREVVCRWPTIKAALGKFGAIAEEER